MKRWPAVILAACLLAGSPALNPSPTASAAQPSPAATVESFHKTLLKVADGASAQQRFDRLTPAIQRAFDMELMARIAGGPAWQKADAAARDRLEEALLRFSAAYYASQFEDGSDLRFVLEDVGDGPGKTKLVNTKLVVPDREAVKMVYVMREEPESGNWRIADVLLDGGISQLAQRRSEYHRIATDEGAPGLTKALNEKADQLLAQR